MIKRGQNVSFALETREPVLIEKECFGQNLNCNVAVKTRIARAVDLTHSTHAELKVNFVVAEFFARR